MSILSGILGSASEIDAEKLAQEFEPILVDGEQIERAFRFIRDMFVFTDRRLVLVDRQGATGKKVEYHSIPYSAITHFSVETAGRFDLDAEMKIWISGNPHPVERQLKKGADIIGVQKTLAQYVLDQR
jgi:hypothetical protein